MCSHRTDVFSGLCRNPNAGCWTRSERTIMSLTARFSAGLLLLELLTACVAAPKGEVLPSASPAPTSIPPSPQPTLLPTVASFPSPAPLTKDAIASCPVTLPNGKAPPAPGLGPGVVDTYYGNEDGTLFTIPWPEGTVIFARGGPGYAGPDGSLAMKWPWRRGVPGNLTIEGQRLDAPAPPPRAEITEGYGDSGFLPISLIFPTQGCWEITGKVGNVRLTFVTLVIKVPFKFIILNWVPKELVSTKYDTSNLPDSYREIASFSGGGEVIMESSVNGQAIITPDLNATQQKVMVQGNPGICVQGALVNQQWQDNVDAGFLQWTADGSSYRVSQQGLGLQCEDLLSMIYAPS